MEQVTMSEEKGYEGITLVMWKGLSDEEKENLTKDWSAQKKRELVDYLNEEVKKSPDYKKKQLQTLFKASNEDELRMQVLQQLAMRNAEGTRGATEYLSKYVLSTESIHTLRDSTEQMWIYREGVYVPFAETYIKYFISKIVFQAYTERLAKEVIDKIKAKTYTEPLKFFDLQPKDRICLKNGIYDISSKEFYPHTPREYHFCKLPVEYDPQAICDKIQEFFREVLANPEEDLLVIQEMIGWLIYKEYKPEKAVMLFGEGRNGKGKTLELLQAFIGEENYSSVPLHELDPRNNQYSSSSLMNKLANFGGDAGDQVFRDTSILRGLTGRDSIEAQRKYLDSVKFRNYAKLIFAANKPPRVYDNHEGFWGRWVWLRFPYTFLSKQDYEARGGDNNDFLKLRDMDIVSKILSPEQLSGMFNWGVEGLERINSKGDFSGEKTSSEIRVEWTRNASAFEAFCMDCLKEDYKAYIDKSELRRAFSVYCRVHKKQGASDDAILAILQERFGVSESRPTLNGERVRCYVGVRFLEEREDHPEHGKFSFSKLGFEEDDSDFYRVKNFIKLQESKSVGGLVDHEFIVSSLSSVDVEAAINALKDSGELIEPKAGRYKLL